MEKLFEAIERYRILYLNSDFLMTDVKAARLKHPEINRISIEDAERANKRNIQRLKHQCNEIPYNLYFQAIHDLKSMYKYDKEARETLYNEITPKIKNVMKLYNGLVLKHKVSHVDNVTGKYIDFVEVSKGFSELYDYYFSLKEVSTAQPPPENQKTSPNIVDDYKKPIGHMIEILSEVKGCFKRGQDYDRMIEMLSGYAHGTEYEFDTVIELEKNTKTRVIKVFNPIYKKIGKDEVLKKDIEFLNIIKVLEPFSKWKTDRIYEAMHK